MEVGDLLGIRIEKRGPNEFYLTQPALTEKVFQACNMGDDNGVNAPNTGKPVGADLDGPTFNEDWEC